MKELFLVALFNIHGQPTILPSYQPIPQMSMEMCLANRDSAQDFFLDTVKKYPSLQLPYVFCMSKDNFIEHYGEALNMFKGMVL